jgi:hypothetical protein
MISHMANVHARPTVACQGWHFRRIVLLELPAWQLLIIAACIGVLWAASLFDVSFVAGHDAFWWFPRGSIKSSENDMAQVLVAYFYYVQSPWQLPLFYVPSLGTPVGTNVIFMDVVPIVALVGKLIHSLTGGTPNLYGAYLFLCFALPGVMMTFVLIAANLRHALAAVIAAVFADTTPTLLWRWGHIALEAQFLLIGALALYLISVKRRALPGVTAAWIAYLVYTYLTNIYLFAMIGTVWLCGVIQRRLAGLTTTREMLASATLTVCLVTAVIALGGQFGAGNGFPFAWYGHSSMNLLSPFVPQESGLLPWLGGVIDGTGGQYEGFNYLGLGLLLGSIAVLPAEVAWLARNLRRHAALFAAFCGFAAFAVSHRVFAGDRLLFELPVPIYINLVLGIFRSSGRFFWLIVYAQMAIVIVLGFCRARPAIALFLVGAAILQLADVQPLREQIVASIGAPRSERFDRSELAELMAQARRVEVVPSYQCSVNYEVRRANMELMLAAARANLPTNTVYLRESLTLRDVLRAPSRPYAARREAYCAQEMAQAEDGGRRGDILVLLSDRPRPQEMAPGVTCVPLSAARFCEGGQ